MLSSKFILKIVLSPSERHCQEQGGMDGKWTSPWTWTTLPGCSMHSDCSEVRRERGQGPESFSTPRGHLPIGLNYL